MPPERIDAPSMGEPLSLETLSEGMKAEVSDLMVGGRGVHSLMLLDTRDVPDAHLITDYVTKWLVCDVRKRPLAVVLCSSPTAPGLVARGMERARKARAMLGADLGRVILQPLREGEFRGISYTVLPYAEPLHGRGFVARIRRRRLQPHVLDWLVRVNQRTRREVDATERDRDFLQPLEHLAALTVVPQVVRSAAAEAAKRLRDNHWTPRHVLMHGDFWIGNILRDVSGVTGSKENSSPGRFIVIDWPGAVLNGYAFFDLVRFARAVRLSTRRLRNEVERHCAVLDCGIENAPGHLLAALGYLEQHRERFPLEHFARMAVNCLDTLHHACRTRSGR